MANYQIVYGIGQLRFYRACDGASGLIAALRELGIEGDITPPPPQIRSSEWVHTDWHWIQHSESDELGDMMQVEWYEVPREAAFDYHLGVLQSPGQA